ncbi:MAG: 30S ribosomal protein S19 [Candidatus Hydrothermarchaeales archaeon]
MAKKVFAYRGFNLEEIKKMKREEFLVLLPSRQRRSLMRGLPEKQEKLMAKIEKVKDGEKIKLRTHCRDVIITPEMLDLTIHVYNGKAFTPVTIKPEMLGHYLGEFTLTRGKVRHGVPGIGATKSSLYIPLK